VEVILLPRRWHHVSYGFNGSPIFLCGQGCVGTHTKVPCARPAVFPRANSTAAFMKEKRAEAGIRPISLLAPHARKR